MGQPRLGGLPHGQGKHSWGGGGAFGPLKPERPSRGWRDNSGDSSRARCDPGEVLSLLHVSNGEVVTTIPALPSSQGPC